MFIKTLLEYRIVNIYESGIFQDTRILHIDLLQGSIFSHYYLNRLVRRCNIVTLPALKISLINKFLTCSGKNDVYYYFTTFRPNAFRSLSSDYINIKLQ